MLRRSSLSALALIRPAAHFQRSSADLGLQMGRIIFDNPEDLEEFIVADILRWPETKRRWILN
jgi:hypothetical protein